MGEIQRPVLG